MGKCTVHLGFMSSRQWTVESCFISSCQRSTMTGRARLERSHADLEQFGSRVPLISALPVWYTIITPDDSAEGVWFVWSWMVVISWLWSRRWGMRASGSLGLVDLQIRDINLFIFRVCQLHRTAAPSVKQRTGEQIPLQGGNHMTSVERVALLCSIDSQGV